MARYKDDHPDAPIYFYDRAVFEYGNVEEIDQPFPTTTPELFYLKQMQTLLEKDWQVDLESQGYRCASAVYSTAKRQFDQKDDSDEAMKARLNLAYANVLGRLLLATIATRSGVDSDLITREHERWARQLLASAERCLLGEQDHWRRYRQTWDRIAAGMLLARWAVDGPRVGLLGFSATVEVRTQALHVLADAMRAIPSLEADARRDNPPAGLRMVETVWEPVRCTVEKEILDLEGQLAN